MDSSVELPHTSRQMKLLYSNLLILANVFLKANVQLFTRAIVQYSIITTFTGVDRVVFLHGNDRDEL